MLGISVATLCNRTKDGIINSVNSQGIPISNTNGIKMPRYYSLEEIERARPEIEEKIKLWEIFHGKRK